MAMDGGMALDLGQSWWELADLAQAQSPDTTDSAPPKG